MDENLATHTLEMLGSCPFGSVALTPCTFLFSLGFQGKFDEADKLNLQGIKIMEKELGPNHPDLATSLTMRAALLGAQVRAATKFRNVRQIPQGTSLRSVDVTGAKTTGGCCS